MTRSTHLSRPAIALALVCSAGLLANPARSQSIQAASDGTGTTVTLNGHRFDISGGSFSGDGTNLFHSFQRLNLSQGEIANFLATPQLRNVLGRVVGGEASQIDGLIQLSGGTANLYLMNPVGMVFGPNASLNVPASFTATTADGIGFAGGWFYTTGTADYAALNGTPNQFAFSNPQPGSLVNRGHLAVPEGENLTLLAGTLLNTGTLTAPQGTVTLAAIPGEKLVRIRQAGMLLSLEVEPWTDISNNAVNPLSLPELLTQANLGNASEVTVASDGTVRLQGSGLVLPTESGTSLIAGTVDVSGNDSQTGGTANILGDRVALLSATVDASGGTGGGTVLIGGGFQGTGTIQNAEQTFVSPDSSIRVDALHQGDGGRIILWADNATQFYGNISTRGGNLSGDGGFVEVSGKQHLVFQGEVDASAANGNFGTLLLDPTNITIMSGTNDGDDNGALTNAFGNNAAGDNGQVTAGDAIPTVIFESELELLSGNTNIELQATNNIVLEDLADNTLFFQTGTGSITFRADADNDGVGSFIMQDTDDGISTQGRDLTISGASLTLGEVSVTAGGTLGNVTLSAHNGDISVNSIGRDNSDIVGNGHNIRLTASGTVFLNGPVQAGGTLKTSNSTIEITAARLRGTNPLPTSQDRSPEVGGTVIPASLWAFPTGVPDTNPNLAVTAPIAGKFVLNLPGDPVPKVAGTGDTLMTITLLQDTTFSVGRPLGLTGSGVEGAIALGADDIPPRIDPLLQNNFFEAAIPVALSAPDAPVPNVDTVTTGPNLAGLDTNVLDSQNEMETSVECETADRDDKEDEILEIALDTPANRASTSASEQTEKQPNPCITR